MKYYRQQKITLKLLPNRSVKRFFLFDSMAGNNNNKIKLLKMNEYLRSRKTSTFSRRPENKAFKKNAEYKAKQKKKKNKKIHKHDTLQQRVRLLT